MNTKRLWIAGALVVTLAGAALAGKAEARWGCGPAPAALTAQQQEKAQEIRAKYEPRLERLAAKLRTTGRELDEALAEGDTERAEALKNERLELEKDYAKVRAEARVELRQAGLRGAWVMGPGTCPWHDGRGRGAGHLHGRAMAMGGGMGPWGCDGPGTP